MHKDQSAPILAYNKVLQNPNSIGSDLILNLTLSTSQVYNVVALAVSALLVRDCPGIVPGTKLEDQEHILNEGDQ